MQGLELDLGRVEGGNEYDKNEVYEICLRTVGKREITTKKILTEVSCKTEQQE